MCTVFCVHLVVFEELLRQVYLAVKQEITVT